MEIILSKHCQALTGSLGKGFGYYIRRVRHQDGSVRFFSQRSKWDVPADGHLRFIFACAKIAQMKTHITDIRVSANELRLAFNEANLFYCDRLVKAHAKQIYNAGEALNFMNCCNL